MNEPKWALHLWKDDGSEILDQVLVTTSLQDGNYRLRSLRSLVESAADSFLFLRVEDEISNVTEMIPDTPWRIDVGDLILKHFKYELLLLMPQGKWNLGVRADSFR